MKDFIATVVIVTILSTIIKTTAPDLIQTSLVTIGVYAIVCFVRDFWRVVWKEVIA